MNINDQVSAFIEANRNEGSRQSIETYNEHVDSLENRGNLTLTQYLSVGEVIRPIHEFKVYIGKTLFSIGIKDLLVVYRIISKYKDHIHPVFFNDGIPKVVILYYKNTGMKRLQSKENLTYIIMTETISQLMMITSNCSTMGRIQLD